MRSLILINSLIAIVGAAEPWLNEPDTGLVDFLAGTNYTQGTLPQLKDIRAIVDFDWAAEQFLSNERYSFYRTASAGEWSEFTFKYDFVVMLTFVCKRLPKQPRYLVKGQVPCPHVE